MIHALSSVEELEKALTHNRRIAVREALRGNKEGMAYQWAMQDLEFLMHELMQRKAYAKRQEARTAAL